MDKAKEIRKGEELNWINLEKYIKERLPEIKGTMEVAQFHGGHANLTYLLSIGDKEYVLRRPPFGKIAPGAHDMKREFKVLSKLYKYFEPAPRAYLYCDDNKVIGARFVLIERRRGEVIRRGLPESLKRFEQVEKRIAAAMVKAQAELHLVDYHKAELSDLGRPEGFVNRQLAGWSKRWELSRTDESTSMDEILSWLSSDIPKSPISSIIHNDIKLDNCQLQPDNPDKITAIFDWDMCTLGDPLIDFGTTLSYWPDDDKRKIKNLPIALKGDWPTKEYLIEQYVAVTGYDLRRITWYETFSYWKNAVVLQQLYKRYVDGETKDQRMANLGFGAAALAQLALNLIESN